MELSDKPSFVVAGVTDWTAAGGHGSDSSLRTSEALVHETLTLKPGKLGASITGQRISSGEAMETEDALRKALAADPGGFDANHRLGDLYFKSGKLKAALPLLKSAYDRKPEDLDNEYELAVAYEDSGDLSLAHQHAERLLARGEKAEWHGLAAEVDEKLNDPLNAVREYERAALLFPSEANYFNWGTELFVHRAVWQAQEVFQKGAETYPQSSRMWTALGAAQFSGALYDKAAYSLCQASDLDPAATTPYEFMGKIELAAPNPLPCIPAKLARFHQEQPENALANFFYAMAIWKGLEKAADEAELKKVEALLIRAITLDPKCADGYFQLGNLSASRLSYKAAIVFYKQAIEANPQLSDAYYRLGVAYDRSGMRDLAQQEFQRHDEIKKAQAFEVERERREVKQFLIVDAGGKTPTSNP
jgi:tetratricopeptide (TPR) repeat protein